MRGVVHIRGVGPFRSASCRCQVLSRQDAEEPEPDVVSRDSPRRALAGTRDRLLQALDGCGLPVGQAQRHPVRRFGDAGEELLEGRLQ